MDLNANDGKRKTKQVLVVRADLKVHKGKMCSQAAHGAMMFLTKRLRNEADCYPTYMGGWKCEEVWFAAEQMDWILGDFTKVTLRVDSLDELMGIYHKAKEAGLEAHLVEDNGTTEFGGVKTPTCVAIGPDYVEKIDPITKDLRLY